MLQSGCTGYLEFWWCFTPVLIFNLPQEPFDADEYIERLAWRTPGGGSKGGAEAFDPKRWDCPSLLQENRTQGCQFDIIICEIINSTMYLLTVVFYCVPCVSEQIYLFLIQYWPAHFCLKALCWFVLKLTVSNGKLSFPITYCTWFQSLHLHSLEFGNVMLWYKDRYIQSKFP